MAGRLLQTVALLAAISFGVESKAQDTIRWSDIDCGQSRIAAPSGLKCRATQDYAGGHSGWEAGAGGTFRRWTAFGAHGGAGLFYYLAEATSPGASIMEGASLKQDIRSEMRDSNMIHDFSPLGHRGGVDYMTFTSASGHACVGIRRYGPSQGDGYQWILYGVRCDPRGRPVTDAEIEGFIASATYRGS
jgi:hypothetical protein